MPPEVPLLNRDVLAILRLLFLHIKFRIVLSRSVKNSVGILMGIALNQQIAFFKIAIFTMLILPIQKHWRSFHIFGIFFNCFLQRIKILMVHVYHIFGQCYPKVYDVVCGTCGDVSLICFSTNVSSVYSRAMDFFELILYPATLLKVFISCRNSLVDFIGSLMQTIISSSNSESLTSFRIVFP